MKTVFCNLLAMSILTAPTLLAYDERVSLIQEHCLTSTQNEVIVFTQKVINNVMVQQRFPIDDEQAFIYSIGMRLIDQKWPTKKKAPYYNNLDALIDYFLHFDSEHKLPQKKCWKRRLIKLKKTLIYLSFSTNDTKIRLFSSGILQDKSVEDFHELIKYILHKQNSKNTI